MDPFDKHLDDVEAFEREHRLVEQTDNGPRPDDRDQPDPDVATSTDERTDLV